MGFDPQPELDGETLRLRPLRPEDREPLYEAASDPLIWEVHPRKDRHDWTVFSPYFDTLLASRSTLVVIDKATDTVIGCSRYYEEPTRPGTIAIGYTFLARSHWGGAANFEMKRLMFDHAFRSFDEVWLDVGPDNIRSRKATAKLGAVHMSTGPLDLGTGVADEYLSYVMTKSGWKARRKAGPA